MDNQTFEAILNKYLSGTISEQERIILSRMLDEQKHREVLEAIIDEELEEHAFEAEEDSDLLSRIWENIQLQKETEQRTGKVIWFHWRRMAVAAVILLLVGSGAYLYWNANKVRETGIADQKPSEQNKDIAPGSNKAVLQLADGTQILLDSVQNGTLAQQSTVSIVKLDNGQLAYHSQKGKPTEILYNTISTPKGGQYQMVLADGTKVWLNAASSLRFPAAFTGNKREVELKGEGYFEVAKNATMPFHVRVNGMDIRVLGTHFNVNAYSDENALRTTLLEGSVKVSSGTQERLLKPGQQAAAYQSGQLLLEESVDVVEVVAWKDGMFQFKSADLETIMRQAARWYDIEIEYKERIADRFSGQIARNVNISQLLKILELTGKVHFEIEGRKVIVKS